MNSLYSYTVCSSFTDENICQQTKKTSPRQTTVSSAALQTAVWLLPRFPSYLFLSLCFHECVTLNLYGHILTKHCDGVVNNRRGGDKSFVERATKPICSIPFMWLQHSSSGVFFIRLNELVRFYVMNNVHTYLTPLCSLWNIRLRQAASIWSYPVQHVVPRLKVD